MIHDLYCIIVYNSTVYRIYIYHPEMRRSYQQLGNKNNHFNILGVTLCFLGPRILFQRGLRRHRHSGARYHRMDKMCNGQQTNIPYLDEFDVFDVLWWQTHCCIFCICLCLHVVTIYIGKNPKMTLDFSPKLHVW